MSAPGVTGVARQAQDYLAAVEHELIDLPGEERAALLEDLQLHLEALQAEDDDRPLAVRLGSPQTYAADLRAAAGLPARGSVRSHPARVERLRQAWARLDAYPLTGEVRRLLVELRPAWWVLRGYLVVFVLCSLNHGQRDGLLPTPLGSRLLGLLLVLAAVAGSVRLGRRALAERPRKLLVAGGALLAVVAFVQGVESRTWTGEHTYYADSYAQPYVDPAGEASEEYPLVSVHGPVTDVLPYAADGTPLTGVLLYDQDGRPLHVGRQQWWADGCTRVLRQPLAADGVPVPNAFPQTYVVDATGVEGPADGGPTACDATVDRPPVPLPQFPAASAIPSAIPSTASSTAPSTAPATSAPAPATTAPAPVDPATAPTPGG